MLCKAQGLTGINKAKKDPSERYAGIVKELYKAIFFQRPLKSQKGLIGKCSLEPSKTRCSVSRPDFELFRMYSFINTIKLKESSAEKFRFLTEQERESIKSKFYRKSKPTFTFLDLKKVLGEENRYNYKDNTTVSGCPTIAALILVFGEDWGNTIYEKYTDKIIRNLKNDNPEEIKTKDDVIADVWHVLSTFTSDEKLIDFSKNKIKLSQKDAEKFSKIHLKKDYASLSLYAIKKILPYLENGLLYSHAVFMANMDKIIKPELWRNKDVRELIEREIGEIINNHQEENKMLFAVNSALKVCFDNNQTYSKEAENGYKNDVLNQLKKEFGERTWENKSNKEILFTETFEIFIQKLKERKHPAIKRIDEKIMEFLWNNDLLKPNASDVLYHPSDIEKFKPTTIKDKDANEFKGLGSPDVGSIKNPMAMKALYQLKKLINTLIIEEQIDEKTKVNIELSRQLNDANKRKAIKDWQDDRKDLYEVYEKKIKELYKTETGMELKEVTDNDIEKFGYVLEQRKDGKLVSKEDVMKYALWEEQNHVCIYTGNTISLSSFLGANPSFDIEHTLPRSRSWDNSQMNKTLCDKKFNQQTKGNKTPFELPSHDTILPRIQHWKDKYEALANEIEKKKRSTRGATDKEQKDKLIQQRHYLTEDYKYWKGKYDRFVMEEIKEGFKNSQAVDIGIISKYATAYLKSVFNKVYSVKGEMVSEYRKAWGLHDTFKDKWGRTHYKPKDRSNHIHHCIDAVTIACMNKNKYDILAHAWGLEDKGDYEKAKKALEKEKPWNTFTQDVRNLENEVFIVHQSKDVLPTQTKKKFRKKGKIQYRYADNLPKTFFNKKEGKDYFVVIIDGKKKYKLPIFQQGDTVRGSLHKLNYIGVIAQPEFEKGKPKKEKGAFVLQKDDNGKVSKFYVKRNPVSKDFSENDVKKIVDEGIKKRIEKHGLKNVKTPEGFILLPAEKKDVNGSEKDLKEMHIKKIRLFEKDKPIEVKRQNEVNLQTEKALRKKHKHHFYAQNDENYCMAIYEGVNEKGKTERAYELVNNIDAGEFFKLSKRNDRKKINVSLVPEKHIESSYQLKFQNLKPLIIKKGISCILLNEEDENIDWNNQVWLKSRMYVLTGIDGDGIKLSHNQDARSGSDAIKFMNNEINMQKFEAVIPELKKINGLDFNTIKADFFNPEIKTKDVFDSIQKLINNHYKENNIVDPKGKLKIIKLKESGLTTPKGGDVIENYKSFPYVKFKVSGFYSKIQNIDFKITTTGKIIPIKQRF